MKDADNQTDVVKSAYHDAEGWILFGTDGEPVEWPESWPDEIDVTFLREHGVEIGA